MNFLNQIVFYGGYDYYERSLNFLRALRIIIPIVWVVTGGIIFGCIVKAINSKKGYEGGFWMGFFLRGIGIIIAATRPTNTSTYNYSAQNSEELYQRLHTINTEGTVPSDSTNRFQNSEWKCLWCGKINPSYTGTCSCGRSRRDQFRRAIEGTSPESTPFNKSEWICPRCGRTNPSYTGTCSCGTSRNPQVQAKSISLVEEKPAPEIPTPAGADPVQMIKGYKELLDMGAITQEEYDRKKAELLNL